jgi:hypothetical protein
MRAHLVKCRLKFLFMIDVYHCQYHGMTFYKRSKRLSKLWSKAESWEKRTRTTLEEHQGIRRGLIG